MQISTFYFYFLYQKSLLVLKSIFISLYLSCLRNVPYVYLTSVIIQTLRDYLMLA